MSIILFLILLLPELASGQTGSQARIERVEKGLLPSVLLKGEPGWTIADRMKFYKVPGVSIAVIQDFKVAWAKAYGVKDIETNEPVTVTTLFQAGSISKSIAATVALKKVEQGKISLDEDINNKLTTWKLPENEFTAKKKVTLLNLLSHTAGLTVHGFPGYEVGAKLPTLPQVLDGAPPANTAPVRVNVEPGTIFRYSGGGTTIAQLAIMDIEKKPYPQIAKETVLEPLGMNDSTYNQPLPDSTRKMAASGHRSNGRTVDGKIHIYPEMAAAGLWTTPTDLARFAIELQLSLVGKSNKVLTKDTVTRMVTPVIDQAGLGLFLDNRGKATYFGHGGADEGFRAQLLVHRDKGYGAAVMINSDNGQIIEEILRAIAYEYQWEDFLPQPYEVVSVDPKKLDGYVGRYLVNPDRILAVTTESGRLYGQPTAESRVELFPVGEDLFVRKDADLQYTFLRDVSGKVNRLKIRNPQTTFEAAQVPAERLVPFEQLASGRVAEAIDAYRKIKQNNPGNVAMREERLNTLGYLLLGEKKYSEAIALFKLNVEFYPASWNAYDSLGEAYMRSGDKELARKNYARSLELDPTNRNAAEMLKKLQQ